MKQISKKQGKDLEEARGRIEAAGHDFNEAVREFERLRDEIQMGMDLYFQDRSEAWQESERGAAFEEWHGMWMEPVCDEWDEVLVDADSYPATLEEEA